MKVIVAHNHYDEEHLAEVAAQMATLGAPQIKAIYLPAYDAYMALEGCHRLRAAHAMGLEPIIDEQEYSDTAMASDYVEVEQDDISIEALLDDAHRREMLEF